MIVIKHTLRQFAKSPGFTMVAVFRGLEKNNRPKAQPFC